MSEKAEQIAGTVAPGAVTALLQDLVRAPAPELHAWDAWLRPGVVVGRFELLRELGRGGFGVIYEARDQVLGRAVAFKAVRVGEQLEPGTERLLSEAEAAARLSHPNLATLFDVGRSEHGPYLILELLHGRTLARRLSEGALPLREVLRVASDVARGVAHAHAHGVTHRDLTPGNVFLCDDGQVKVLDFGMAHAFGHRKLDGGTPAYMAPEQWRGAPEDERTDVFALGVILQEMLSGERPFPAAGRDGHPGRRRVALDVPEVPGLDDLVARMLSEDPVERPRHAGEVLAALEALRIRVGPPPAGATVRPPPRARAGTRGGVLARLQPREGRGKGARLALAIAAIAFLAGALGLAWLYRAPRDANERSDRRQTAPVSRASPSIAVVPFADLSPQRDQEYFSDGIAEEILNVLARVEGLHVAGRTSSFSFRGKGDDLRDISRKLGVGAVLEGSVRKEGDRVRITAQLVSAEDGFRMWSDSYDRQLTGVLAVQDEIARAVVDALKVKLLTGPSTARRHEVNPEAHDQYLLGVHLWNMVSKESNRRASEALERAVAVDPSYAPAWAALAIARFGAGDYTKTEAAERESCRGGLAAIERALALDPELALGYSTRSVLRASCSWDWSGAQNDIERALALNPGDVYGQRRHGVLLLTLGQPAQAIPRFRRAIELDPLVPLNWRWLARALVAAGDPRGAREALRRVLELLPADRYAAYLFAISYLLEGDHARALASSEPLSDDDGRQLILALASHARGDAAGSRRALDVLVDRVAQGASGAGYEVAVAHAWRGERDRAFEWLERSFARHEMALTEVKSDPLLRTLRGDPRYTALLRKLKLPAD